MTWGLSKDRHDSPFPRPNGRSLPARTDQGSERLKSRRSQGTGGGEVRSSTLRERDEHGRDEGRSQGTPGSSARFTQNRGRSEANRSFASSQNRSGNRSVISHTVRVLNEIETRLHERREELQYEQGASSQRRGLSMFTIHHNHPAAFQSAF
jgi:hypothetical protein